MNIKLDHIEYEIEIKGNDLYFHIIWMDEAFRGSREKQNRFITSNGWEIISSVGPYISSSGHIILYLRGERISEDNKIVIVNDFNNNDYIEEFNSVLNEWDKNYQFEDKVELVMEGVLYKRVSCEYVGTNDGKKRFIVELEEIG